MSDLIVRVFIFFFPLDMIAGKRDFGPKCYAE